MQFFNASKKGFTLVEMVISMAIFSMVVVVALGALVKVISANKKAQTLQSALTNLNFGLESMSRELRESRTYHCDTNTDSGGYGNGGTSGYLQEKGCDVITSPNEAVIAFTSAKTAADSTSATGICNLVYVYRLRNDPTDLKLHLEKAEQKNCNQPAGNTTAYDLPTTFTDVLSTSNITLEGYSVEVGPYSNSAPNGLASEYPYFYIRLKGYAGARERDRTYFDIQTAVSSRTRQK